MVQMTKVVRRPGKHIMVYGPPKVGKSDMVARLAEEGFLLDYLDLENSSQTFFQEGERAFSEEAKSRINLIRIPDTPTWPVAIETVMKVTTFPKLKVLKICTEHGKLDCPYCSKNPAAEISEINFGAYTDKHILVIDSLNQLGNSSMFQITKNIVDDNFKPGWDEYGPQGRHLDRVLAPIQNSPYNIICITHEIVTEKTMLDKEKEEKIYPLTGTKNYSRTVGKFFDDIVHMDIYNRRHRATTSTIAEPLILTGSRNGVKLEGLKQPSLMPIFDPNWKSDSQEEKANNLLKGIQK